MGCLPDDQVPQIAFMALPVQKRNSFCGKIIPHTAHNSPVVFIDELAHRSIRKIIEASAPVHAERKWSSFIRIAERKLHFIAITRGYRAFMHRRKPAADIASAGALQKAPDLSLLDLQLLLVWQRQITAAAAFSENRTGRRRLRRRF